MLCAMGIIRSADNLAREYTEEAIETLADIMRSEDNRDRLSAAKELLDRGHGKPLSATIALPISRQQAAALAAMSDEDLMAAVTGAPLPRLIKQAPKHDPLLD